MTVNVCAIKDFVLLLNKIYCDMTFESRNIEAGANRPLLGNSLLNAPLLQFCSRHSHGNNFLEEEYTRSKTLGGGDIYSVLPKL
jgi:hypothetical protein